MAKERSFIDKFFLFIKGLAMGTANKVPGVSGGIVAFVTGFYEELIYSLQKINGKAFKLLLNGRFKSFYQYINGRFLSLLILGMLISYFSISKILDYLIAGRKSSFTVICQSQNYTSIPKTIIRNMVKFKII